MIKLTGDISRLIPWLLVTGLLISISSAVFAGNDTGTVVAQNSQVDGADPSDEVFDPTRMERLDISIAPNDWQRIRNRENGWFRVNVGYRGLTFNGVGVESRDASRPGDCFPSRPSLVFDFGRFNPDLRFYGMKKFLLRSFCGDDDTLLVEEVEIKLFNDFGIATERLTHVKVFVNNEYIGPYNLMDRDRNDMSNIVPRWFDDPSGPLYLLKNTSARVPPDAFQPLAGQDPSDPFSYIPSAFREVRSNPGDGEDLVALIRAFNPPVDPKEIERWLDVDSLITYLAVDSSFGDTDGLIAYTPQTPEQPRRYFQNNCHFYHDPITGKFFVEPMGDLDDGLIAFDPNVVSRPLTDGWNLFTVTRWLLDDPNLMIYFRTIVRSFLDTVFRPAPLRDYVNQRAALIRNAVREDLTRVDRYRPLTMDQWEARVQQLMNYFAAREANVRNQLGP